MRHAVQHTRRYYHIDVLYTDAQTGARLNDADIVYACNETDARRQVLRQYRNETEVTIVLVEVMPDSLRGGV